jgi:hypothetical protein
MLQVLPLSLCQIEVGDAYDLVYLLTRNPKLGIRNLYVRIGRMSLLHAFSSASITVPEGVRDGHTIERHYIVYAMGAIVCYQIFTQARTWKI